MSSITKVAGGKYRARWRAPEGGSRSRTFATKRDAENHLTKMDNSKLDGDYVDQQAGRVTLGEYATAWAAMQPYRDTTAASVEMILRKHIEPAFGSRRISTIRTSEIQSWIAGLALAPSTTAVVYGKLAAIFGAAVEDRLIPRSPCTKRVRLPRPDGGEVAPMAPEQVRAMIDAVGDRYGALLVLLAGAGLRPGEALGLTVDRVEFVKRTIRVDRQLITTVGTPPRLGPTKTTASVRTIPVPDSVLYELARHLEHYAPHPELGVIFTDGKGDTIRRNALGHLWRRAAIKADVAGFTPHSLRHFAASVMIDQGASVKAVQRHLGHASASTTLDTYAHLWPDSEDVTRRALEAGLVAIVSPACHDTRTEA